MTEPISLRPYQDVCIEMVRHSFRTGHRAPLLVLPTAGGKTIIFVFVTKNARAKGKRVLIVVHRVELLQQAVDKLNLAGVTCGVIAAGFEPDASQLIQVGSIQTIARRLDQLPDFDLIILDEGHHSRARQWLELFKAQTKSKLLGVTATAARLDGKGLGVDAGGPFDDLLIGAEADELITGGFLSAARVFVPEHKLDLRGVRTKLGDYVIGDLEEVVDKVQLTGDAIAEYRQRADHQPCIAFCVSIKHASNVAEAFREAGYKAQMVSGKTPRKLRRKLIQGLGTGEVEVLTTCDLISEGLDVPAVGCVSLLRPTKSLVLHRQQIGRGMRPADGKTHLVVLDHVSNSLEHGLPTTRIAWSLNGVKKKRAGPTGEAPCWRCEDCGCQNDLSSSVCAECGASRPYTEREVAGVNGLGGMAELTQDIADRVRNIPYREFAAVPRTEAEVKVYGKLRGYKTGWAWHFLQAQSSDRQAVSA